MVPAVINRIFQTPVTLGNISRILLIFVMFKDSYPLTMFTQITLSLVHQLRLLAILTFVPLPYLFG